MSTKKNRRESMEKELSIKSNKINMLVTTTELSRVGYPQEGRDEEKC